MIDAESLRSKTSKERRDRLVQADRGALYIASRLIDEAQTCGDLVLDLDATKEDLIFGMGSLLNNALPGIVPPSRSEAQAPSQAAPSPQPQQPPPQEIKPQDFIRGLLKGLGR